MEQHDDSDSNVGEEALRPAARQKYRLAMIGGILLIVVIVLAIVIIGSIAT